MSKSDDSDGVVYKCEQGCPTITGGSCEKTEKYDFRVEDKSISPTPKDSCIEFTVVFVNDKFSHCDFRIASGNTSRYSLNQWKSLKMVALQIEKLVKMKRAKANK